MKRVDKLEAGFVVPDLIPLRVPLRAPFKPRIGLLGAQMDQASGVRRLRGFFGFRSQLLGFRVQGLRLRANRVFWGWGA